MQFIYASPPNPADLDLKHKVQGISSRASLPGHHFLPMMEANLRGCRQSCIWSSEREVWSCLRYDRCLTSYGVSNVSAFNAESTCRRFLVRNIRKGQPNGQQAGLTQQGGRFGQQWTTLTK